MRTPAWIALFATLLAGACATEPVDPADVEDGVAVPAGKEDDWLSESAYEYVLEGRTSVVLEAALADADADTKTARVKELIGLKQIAIAWFLTQYLVDKESEDPNASFGGFGGMAKAGAYQDLEVTAIDDVTYEFTFEQIVAGNKYLMSQLPLSTVGGRAYFDLEIGKPTNQELGQLETNHEWYRNSPWDGWNPDTVPADQKETLTLAIDREKASTDAWFDFQGLLADDKLTIDVHFGWDYHDNYHVKHAREVFSWLVDQRDFTPPVASFDELTRTSGPFVRTLDADGREVTVEVRLYYGKSGTDTDPDTDAGGRVLEDDVRASLADSDVIVYSGHSGPFYGFAMGNWRVTEEGDFDDSEMSSAEMPENRYQIVFAEGCDTYHIGEALRSNPAKPDGAFLDVITTTSFSNASTAAAVEDFISRLIERDSHGRHRPRTLKSLLDDLDGNSWGFHTMYGIHGIDDDPALHPYAHLENLCLPCSSNPDCGGIGDLCIGIGDDDGKYCAAACTDDRGCPEDYRCAAVASVSAGTIYAHACVPTNATCTAE